MQTDRTAKAERLLQDVGWAMRRGLGPRDLIPMLKKLVAHAPAGSDAWLFGTRELSKLLAPREPWLAARAARQVLAHVDDHEAWGALGLALSMLGCFRAAARAYRRALALEPRCAATLHNLGHLLDVGLDQPERALHYLEHAHRAAPADDEIAASLALCLARVGRRDEACALLASTHPEQEPSALIDDWLRAIDAD
jgi:tetratricopeptide (TPR) repeat protein